MVNKCLHLDKLQYFESVMPRLFAQTLNAPETSSRQHGFADHQCRRRNTLADSKPHPLAVMVRRAPRRYYNNIKFIRYDS